MVVFARPSTTILDLIKSLGVRLQQDVALAEANLPARQRVLPCAVSKRQPFP